MEKICLVTVIKITCSVGSRMFSTIPHIFANGPAIWGGCVTRHKHRSGSWYFSHKAVTVQGGYGTCFCRHGTNFIRWWRDRGRSFLSGWEIVSVQKTSKWALAQYRGISCLEASNLSRCRILIGCRCACPGATAITKLSREQEQKQKPWQTTYPYCPC